MIKLQYKLKNFCCALIISAMGLVLAWAGFRCSNFVFADNSEGPAKEHFLTIYDETGSLTVKTTAATVGETLERLGIIIDPADIVEPGLDTMISEDTDYNVNIYRAHPALIIDGAKRRYVMTASYDPKRIAKEAGLTIYDGDKITLSENQNFLEAGVATTYRIERNGGRTVTVEESLPYATKTQYDYSLPKGERRLEQAGEDGRKVLLYEVQFENNVEVARTLVSEEIKLEPVTEIVVIGAKQSIPAGRETCAGWAREAGVSEEDLPAALDLIYHESGCRVDARNARSGAYGIPQALPGNKMADVSAGGGADWETNPVTQIRWMINYVNTRYGGWQEAMEFWSCTGQCTNRYGTVNKKGTWY